jgi:hypothetical protein
MTALSRLAEVAPQRMVDGSFWLGEQVRCSLLLAYTRDEQQMRQLQHSSLCHSGSMNR